MEWIVTDDDRKRLKALEKHAKEGGKVVLRKLGAKKFLNMEDMKAIKVGLKLANFFNICRRLDIQFAVTFYSFFLFQRNTYVCSLKTNV